MSVGDQTVGKCRYCQRVKTLDTTHQLRGYIQLIVILNKKYYMCLKIILNEDERRGHDENNMT